MLGRDTPILSAVSDCSQHIFYVVAPEERNLVTPSNDSESESPIADQPDRSVAPPARRTESLAEPAELRGVSRGERVALSVDGVQHRDIAAV